MKVKLKKVEVTGHDPYEDKIFRFSILGELENGRTIEIRDSKPFDLRSFIGKEVDCLISVSVMGYINKIQESNEETVKSPILRGKYLGEYIIPEKWGKCPNFNPIVGKHAIDYEGMIFLISDRDFQRQGIKVDSGEDIMFKAAGLDLLAWLPIEK